MGKREEIKGQDRRQLPYITKMIELLGYKLGGREGESLLVRMLEVDGPGALQVSAARLDEQSTFVNPDITPAFQQTEIMRAMRDLEEAGGNPKDFYFWVLNDLFSPTGMLELEGGVLLPMGVILNENDRYVQKGIEDGKYFHNDDERTVAFFRNLKTYIQGFIDYCENQKKNFGAYPDLSNIRFVIDGKLDSEAVIRVDEQEYILHGSHIVFILNIFRVLAYNLEDFGIAPIIGARTEMTIHNFLRDVLSETFNSSTIELEPFRNMILTVLSNAISNAHGIKTRIMQGQNTKEKGFMMMMHEFNNYLNPEEQTEAPEGPEQES